MDLKNGPRGTSQIAAAGGEGGQEQTLLRANALAGKGEMQPRDYEAQIRALEDQLALAKANKPYDPQNTSEFIGNLRRRLDGTDVQKTQQYQELYKRYRRLCEEHQKLQMGQNEILCGKIAKLEAVYQENLANMEQCIITLQKQKNNAVNDVSLLQSQNQALKQAESLAAMRISQLQQSNATSRSALRDAAATTQMSATSLHNPRMMTPTAERAAQTADSSQIVGSKRYPSPTPELALSKQQKGMIYNLEQKLSQRGEQLKTLQQQLKRSQAEVQAQQDSNSARQQEFSQLNASIQNQQHTIERLQSIIHQQKLETADLVARNAKIPYLQQQIDMLTQIPQVPQKSVPVRNRDVLQRQIAEANQLLVEMGQNSQDAEALRKIIVEAQESLEAGQQAQVAVDLQSAAMTSMFKGEISEICVRVAQASAGIVENDAQAISAAFSALKVGFQRFQLPEANEIRFVVGNAASFSVTAAVNSPGSPIKPCYGRSKQPASIFVNQTVPIQTHARLQKKYLKLKQENMKLQKALLDANSGSRQLPPLDIVESFILQLNLTSNEIDKMLEKCQGLLSQSVSLAIAAEQRTMFESSTVLCEVVDYKTDLLGKGNVLLARLNDALTCSQADNCLLREQVQLLRDQNRYLKLKFGE